MQDTIQTSEATPSDEIARKAERYIENHEFDSKLVGIVGDIPNKEDFINNPGVQSRDVSCAAEELGGMLTFAVDPAYPDSDPGQDIWSVLEPSVSLISTHYREFFGIPAEQPLFPRIDYHCRILGNSPDSPDFSPHFDGSLSDPSPFYVATIGAPTLVYEGHFFTIEKEPGSENWHEDTQTFSHQVADQGITPLEMEQGKIVLLDSHTVHASPESDPTLVGQKRAFLRVIFEDHKADEYQPPVFDIDLPIT